MKVNGKATQSIWLSDDESRAYIIDQTLLPYTLQTKTLQSLESFCHAIVAMEVRGAPLIGVTAAFGFAFALKDTHTDSEEIAKQLLSTRPTAINLHWAVEKIRHAIANSDQSREQQANTAFSLAKQIWQQDIDTCSNIGENGFQIIKEMSIQKNATLHILTHCNAGWLATVDWGTALAPIYKAHEAGIDLHVWVDETRPRNQGYLTAWELQQTEIPHTVIVDNTGGHLMQHGQVDLCIVGSDRTTSHGDVCNKIGTYLKALAAHDNKVPFYVALPTSTIDWTLKNGVKEIPIEQRSAEEVTQQHGLNPQGEPGSIISVPKHSQVANYAFDVTPAKYVSGLITEKGVFNTNKDEMEKLRALC